MEVTFKLKDGMRVIEATAEAIEAFGFADGRKFEFVQTKRGLILMSEEAAQQYRAAERVMDENFEVLRRLAQ